VTTDIGGLTVDHFAVKTVTAQDRIHHDVQVNFDQQLHGLSLDRAPLCSKANSGCRSISKRVVRFHQPSQNLIELKDLLD
jgi:hypothetical protein